MTLHFLYKNTLRLVIALVISTALVQPAAAQTIDASLQKALEATYENNPSIKAQRESLKSLDERMAQAVSGLRPTANIEYDKGRERSRSGANNWSYFDTTTKQLAVSQPLFRGGSTWAEIKSARNIINAGRAELNATTQETLLDAVTAYMDVVQNQSVKELSQKNVDVLVQQLKASQQRFDVGEVTRTDVAQSEARLSRAKAEFSQAQGDLEAAIATYERVTGAKPENPSSLSKYPKIPASIDEARQIALNNNPRLIASRSSEKSANYNVYQRAGQLLPQVALVGRMSRDSGASVFVNDLDTDSLGVNVRIPVYQAGAEYSGIRQSKREYQRQRFNTIDQTNIVNESLTRAWERLLATREAIISNEETIKAAQIALDGVKQEQQFGARTTLDVLDAEQELFAANVNLVRSQRNEVIAFYSLLTVLGELTPKNLALKVDEYDPTDNYDLVKWLPAGF